MKPRQLFLVSCALVLHPCTPSPAWSADKSPTKLSVPEPQQDAEAMFQLARAHLTGQDAAGKESPVDLQKAFDLMQKAAGQGHAEATGGVGYFYANGVAVEKDEAKAVEWFRNGAEKGGARAQYNLSRMLVAGKGVEKDDVAGRELLKKAADQGVAEAVFAAGLMFYFGEHGEPKNRQRAFPLLRQAADQGNLDAQNMVGLMLCEGSGVPRNLAEGMNWYRKAAAQGHAKAQSSLGRMLGAGDRRAEKDPAQRVEAFTWLFLSDAQGEITATKLLQDVVPSADPKELADARRKAGEIRTKGASAVVFGKTVPAAPAPDAVSPQ